MDDAPYWEVSGPRRYLNIPSPVPDRWRAEMTYGDHPPYKSVVGWGPTEECAKEDARRKAEQS